MAVMMLRNPKTLEHYRQAHLQIVELYSQFDRLPDRVKIDGQTYKIDATSWPDFRDGNEDYIKRLWFAEINNAVEYANMFLAMRWSMMMAPRPCFITSDNPIVFSHPSLKFRGIKNQETIIHFPISPTRTLCLDHLHNEPENEYYPVNEEGYIATNLLTWRHSLNYMFSHRHPNNVVRELISEADRRGYI